MDELRVPFGAVRGAEQLQRLGGSGKGQGGQSGGGSSFDLPDPDQLVLLERAAQAEQRRAEKAEAAQRPGRERRQRRQAQAAGA